jgi:hypothetical protein
MLAWFGGLKDECVESTFFVIPHRVGLLYLEGRESVRTPDGTKCFLPTMHCGRNSQ